ncbi:hypothetical protein, partial [Neisseria gonorrhoeae]|uniref:hypothetical protein n=1 Tax=Neisseria gonorrhoeae TaxID=485 RepID=UPI001F2052C9|nr:hypothetical protein [Neisseria gonorrhoeae]
RCVVLLLIMPPAFVSDIAMLRDGKNRFQTASKKSFPDEIMRWRYYHERAKAARGKVEGSI